MAEILHIDASEEVRRAVNEFLSAHHNIKQTASGVLGARTAAEQVPKLILVGARTRDLDAYETTLRLRAMKELAGVPIVLIASDEHRRACFAAGADGVLTYPPVESAVIDIVERFLAGDRDIREETGEIDLREHSHRIVTRLEDKVVELSRANQRLEEVARQRREFLRNVSHELATPMTPIVGYLKLFLNDELGELTPLQRKGLSAVRRSVVRLRDLIDTLLDVSAFERGRLHFYDRSYDFAALARLALKRAQDGSTAEANVNAVIPATGLSSRGDPDKLRRAMVHVIQNALKFSPRGAPIRIAVSGDASECIFEVTDQGPGIDEEDLAHVLEPFYQADGSPTRLHGGVGLGLAFALKVARGMGGDLEVESPPAGAEVGTRVVLRVARGL